VKVVSYPMSIDRSFRETFNSGATRILNAAGITKTMMEKAAEEGGDPQFLFGSRSLNRVVFIKKPKDRSESADFYEEAMRAKKSKEAETPQSQIVTMIYSPFDFDDIPGGGTSFEMGASNQDVMLQEAIGFNPASGADTVERDLQVLGILEELPSLDPFLLKDKMLGAGLEVDETYFDISEEEFTSIKNYILRKFEPITRKVVGSNTEQARKHSEEFIMKLWEGRDLSYLAPITQVFNLDPSHASDIYYAWKGLSYYEFNYKKDLATLLTFADWLQNKSMPAHYVPPEEAVEFQTMSRQVAVKFARHLEQSSKILRSYNDAYEELFVREGEAKQFVSILQQSSDLFWKTSASISALNHAVAVWSQQTVKKDREKLNADELRPLLTTLEKVID
jgi:hypothetical protein